MLHVLGVWWNGNARAAKGAVRRGKGLELYRPVPWGDGTARLLISLVVDPASSGVKKLSVVLRDPPRAQKVVVSGKKAAAGEATIIDVTVDLSAPADGGVA